MGARTLKMEARTGQLGVRKGNLIELNTKSWHGAKYKWLGFWTVVCLLPNDFSWHQNGGPDGSRICWNLKSGCRPSTLREVGGFYPILFYSILFYPIPFRARSVERPCREAYPCLKDATSCSMIQWRPLRLHRSLCQGFFYSQMQTICSSLRKPYSNHVSKQASNEGAARQREHRCTNQPGTQWNWIQLN